MSLRPQHCAKCSLDTTCEQVGGYPGAGESQFAVVWRCPKCGDRSLVVSPIGPLVVTSGCCLNCGQEGSSQDPCPNCGASITEALTADERDRPDAALLQMARAAFALGACRRGLTIANFVLVRSPQLAEAWLIKAQFLEFLGFQVSARAVRQAATTHTSG